MYISCFSYIIFVCGSVICFFSWSKILRVIYNNRRLIDIANGYETAQEQIDIPQQELTDIYYKYVFATDDFEWVKAQAMLEWFDRHLQENYKDKQKRPKTVHRRTRRGREGTIRQPSKHHRKRRRDAARPGRHGLGSQRGVAQRQHEVAVAG